MEYALTTTALQKKYGSFQALNGLTMHVPKGAIYGFVGKNGSGKTTLIRLVCGLQKPTEGEYSIYGVKNKDKEIIKFRRKIGAVVETPSVYLNMTAEDNMKEQYYILGMPSYRDIPELLNLVGLKDAGKKRANDFSLGMRQRLGIAIALAGNPDFLILDEPVNGLDPQGIIEIRELILKLNRERGITILISNHILDELSKIATHFGFIDTGEMIKEISWKELEKACQTSTRITVSDTKILSRILEEMKTDYNILSGQEADIYGKINITDLALCLNEQNCRIISMTQREESLETYYMNLLGGNDNA